MRARIALIVCGALAALLLIEGLLRLSDRVPDVTNPEYSFHASDPVLGWRGSPDLKLRFRRTDFDVLVAHDADGWRIPDPTPPPDPARRILVLGDSFTWGFGVGQGERFTDHLQRALPDSAVVNRGINGYGTGQEFLVLQQELAAQRYDLVVLMFFFNDVADNQDPYGGRRPLFTLADGRLVAPQAPVRPLPAALGTWRLKDYSFAYRLIDYVADVLKGGKRGLPEPGEAPTGTAEVDYRSLPGAAITERLVQAMAETCKAHDTAFVVVYIPQRGELAGQDAPPEVRAVHTLARQAATVSGAPFIDLTPALDQGVRRGEALYFTHNSHWTPAGHALVARTLLATGLLSETRRPGPGIPDLRRRGAQQAGGGAAGVGSLQDRADDRHPVGAGAADGAGAGGVDATDPEQRQ